MSLDSPFAHRLDTNYIPHPDEESGIRDALEAQHAIIRELDHELEGIEAAIAALDMRRNEAKLRRSEHLKLARSHQTMLLGILHLPEDVLSRIFMDLVPTPSKDDWSVGYRNLPHPIVQISHVFSQWRSLVLSVPMLWTTLSFREFPLSEGTTADLREFEKKMELITNIFSTLISRAGMCPINLHLSGGDPGFAWGVQTFSKTVEPFVNLLRQAQWASVNIDVRLRHQPSPLFQLLNVPSRSEATLHKAQFRLIAGGLLGLQSIVDNLHVQEAIQLTSLEISTPGDGFTSGVAFINSKVNWAILVDLTIRGGLSLDEASTVFTRCPNLIRCTIELEPDRVSSWGTEPSGLPQPATLLHLRTLILSGYQPPERFSQSLTLPALQELSILDSNSGSSDRVPLDLTLPEWVRIYGDQLTHITFGFGRLTLPTLLSCFQALPNLISLDVRPPILPRMYPHDERLSTFHRSALLALTAKSNMDELLPPTTLFPSLRKIIIYRPDTQIKVEDLVELVASRRRQTDAAVAYLDSLEVHFLALDSNSAVLADAMTKGVQVALRERGVSPDGVTFHVRPSKAR